MLCLLRGRLCLIKGIVKPTLRERHRSRIVVRKTLENGQALKILATVIVGFKRAQAMIVLLTCGKEFQLLIRSPASEAYSICSSVDFGCDIMATCLSNEIEYKGSLNICMNRNRENAHIWPCQVRISTPPHKPAPQRAVTTGSVFLPRKRGDRGTACTTTTYKIVAYTCNRKAHVPVHKNPNNQSQCQLRVVR